MVLTKKDLKDALKNVATRRDLKRFATRDDLKRFATRDDFKRFATKDDLKRFATKDDLKRFSTRDDLKRFATKDDLKSQTMEFKTYVKKYVKKEIKGGIGVLRVLIEANGAKMDQLLEGYKPNVDQIKDNRTSIENLKPRVETLEDTSRYLLKKVKEKDV